MKIWTGYDSEHSYSLVMIGRFADETVAKQTAKKSPHFRTRGHRSTLGRDRRPRRV